MSKMNQVYGIGQALIPSLPPPQPFETAPTTNHTNYEIGQVVYTPPKNPTEFYIYAGGGTWALFGSSTGDILSIIGTAPISATTVAGVCTLAMTGPANVTTLTAHGVVIGEGTSAMTATAVGTTGQVLIGSTGADPAFGDLGVNSGLTAHGVLLGEGNSAIVATSVGTTGQVLIGSTGADPAFGDLGVNSNLTGLVLGNTNSAFTTASYTAATSFTPAFALATPGDSAWTYTSQVGRYTRIGDIVYFNAQLVWNNFANTTGSGTWQLNLPVASGAFATCGQVAISGSGIDASAETANLPSNFLGVIGNAQSTVVLSVEEGGVGNAANALFDLTVTQVKTAGTMNVSGWYFAA